jgi:hypothetical protein
MAKKAVKGAVNYEFEAPGQIFSQAADLAISPDHPGLKHAVVEAFHGLAGGDESTGDTFAASVAYTPGEFAVVEVKRTEVG